MTHNPVSPSELAPAELRWRCTELLDPAAGLRPPEGTVGQDRALKALRLGLGLRLPGYNVYVSGFPGSGRTTTVRDILATIAPSHCPVLRDRAYVFNFREPERPKLLVLPAGQGRAFREELHGLIDGLRQDVPRILDDGAVKRQRRDLEEHYRRRAEKLVADFESRLKESGFALVKIESGPFVLPELYPVVKGQPVPLDELDASVDRNEIGRDEAAALRERYPALREQFDSIYRQMSEVTRELAGKIEELERRVLQSHLRPRILELRGRYAPAAEYLDALAESVLRDLEAFKTTDRAGRRGELAEALSQLADGSHEEAFLKYRVNLIQDNSGPTGCPVVFEDIPTLANLAGTIEFHVLKGGVARTSFLNIRAGAFVRADGGFLVLDARDLLLQPGSWPALKRVLKTGKLEIGIAEFPFLAGATGLKPEPVEVDLKVVLIGEPHLYELLWHFEEEFRKLFKVKAEFDSDMKLNGETLGHFASIVTRIARDERLLPLDPSALSAMAEEGVRRAGLRSRITARFSEVLDLAREASYWARQSGAANVTAEHVRRALQEQTARHQLLEDKIQDLMDRGILSVEVTGARVGEVNGLSVYDTGAYAFGRPSRVTASASIGRAGIINVEREAGLSGRVHDKGVLIISGFLRERYAQDFPLSLSASLAFEQSYGGVEGDSASSAEIAALLSALSGVPVLQSVAVTGSVDQKGNLQAGGGVNAKIEGFFHVCRSRGLSGGQGVVIPRANAQDLMLRDDVVDAVSRGQFHVWAADTVDQALEILTRVPAGTRDAEGRYPPESLNGRAERRLRGFAYALARSERPTERVDAERSEFAF